MPRSYMVFDIETVPDIAALARAHNVDPDDAEAVKVLLGDGLPPHVFNQVVVIAYMRIGLSTATPFVYERKALHIGDRDEGAIIDEFFRDVDGMGVILVSFSGSGFDIPVLRYRALKHGVVARTLAHPKLYQRYGGEHLDLCDILASHDGRARTSLSKICSLLGIAGKTEGVDGSRVGEMIAAGRINQVAAYRMDDVAATARVFLANEVLEGRLHKTTRQSCVALVDEAAAAEKARVLAAR